MPVRSLPKLPILLLLAAAPLLAANAPIRPKVVVVAMFERGADTGDLPGEFQYWVEREKLDRVLEFPAGHRQLRLNADGSVLGVVTGMGNSNAAATIMALGLDPRFDLARSYWLVAGIAGIDPADASLASAAWAEYIVEGDLAHEIDAREIPADWPTGYLPFRKRRPYELPRATDRDDPGLVYRLDPGLVEWAYQLTKDTPLPETDAMKQHRAHYTDTPTAQRPPFVLKGDNLASSTYWHGQLLNRWANEWVRYHTDDRGNYVTTAMEDSGTLRALTNLNRAKRVDVRRVLVLRTASNYDMQWPGGEPAKSLRGDGLPPHGALLPSFESAHAVGSRVLHALLAGWARFEHELPTAPVPAR